MKEQDQIGKRVALLIRQWLAPPIFPNDELKNRRAALLDLALLATMGLGVILLAGNLLGGKTPLLLVAADGGAILLALVLRYWAHRGYVREASLVVVAVDLVGLTVFGAILGTVRTPTSALYVLIVVGAGLLFDLPGILITTLLGSLAILGLIWAENSGWLPRPDLTVTVSQWISYTTLFGLGGALTWQALRSTRLALARADQEIAERRRAELNRQVSEQYASRIIDSSLDMIVTTDNERRIVEFNRAAEETFGCKREEVIGKHVDLLYASPQDSLLVHDALSEKTRFVGEISNRRKNGEIFTSLLSASILYSAGGEALGTIGVSRDFTERKQAERAVKVAEEKYRTIFESALEGMFQFTPEGRIITANAALAHMLGYASPDELMTKTTDVWRQIYTDPRRQQALLQQVTEEGQVQGFECRLRRKDGIQIWVSENMRAVQNPAGGIEYVEGSIEDIRARKEAEEALRESEERFSSAFEHAAIGVALVSLQGYWLKVNRAFCDLTGYSTDELRFLSLQDLTYPDDLELDQENIQQLVLGKVRSYQREKRYLHKSGRLIHVHVAVSLVRDAEGDPLYFVSQIQDISARKQMEEDKLRRAAQLEGLRQTALELSAQLDLASLLASICERAVKLVQATTGSFYLYRPDRDLLERIIFRGPALVDSKATRQRGEGLIGRVWQTGEPIVVNDYGDWAGRNPVYSNAPSRAVAGIPISWGDRFLGVLTIVADHPKTYSAEDVEVLNLFADQAAVAIENARLFDETKKRADQFAGLYATTLDLALVQDLPTLLQTVVERAVRLLAASGGGMYLYDRARGNLRVEVATHPSTPVGTRLELGEGMAGRVAQTRQPLIVDDYRIWGDRSQKYDGSPLTAVIEVPMVFGGDLIGVLVVEEFGNKPRKFTDEDARILSLFASQAASAVNNARLLVEARQRAAEFAALYDTSHALSTQQDLPSLLDTVVKRAMALLSAPSGFIYLCDAERSEMELAITAGFEFPVGTRLKMGEGMAGRVGVTRKTLLVDDYLTWEGRAAIMSNSAYRAVVEVPMLFGGELIGVLGVNEYGESTRKFTERDGRLLSLFAAQSAAAVHNARLLAATTRYAEQLSLLYDAGLTLNGALQSGTQLEFFGKTAMRALRAGRVDFFRFDSERGELRCEFSIGQGRTTPQDVVAEMVSLSNEDRSPVRIDSGEKSVINLGDVHQDPRWSSLDPEIRSALVARVEHGNQLLGVWSLLSERPNAFSADDERLVVLFANEAAVAMENSRLFDSTQRQLTQLATLREIDRTLNSLLDLTPLLESMLNFLEQIVPYESAAVSLLEGSVLRAVAARGRGHNELQTFELDISHNSLFEKMASSFAPVVVDDLANSPDWVTVPGVEYARTWLAAPLVARGTVIGQIGLYSSLPNSFTRAHADLLLTFANQAAIAIANARLRAELSEQARRDSLTQLLNHGTFIDELRAAVERAKEKGDPVSLIMFDLDNFKRFNDAYGHVVGDAVLRATVQAIRAHVKQVDLVGRWGGEEFLIALIGADADGAQRVAERIRATMTEVQLLDRNGAVIPPPTASQGISTFPDVSKTWDELIDHADQALYRAKAAGRDRIALARERILAGS